MMQGYANKILLATNNAHKALEMKRILEPLGFEVLLPKEAGVSFEADETGATFAENARIKAQAALEASGLPAVADDSGLAVDALNGAPGVYSARYAGEGATDADRNKKLLDAMKEIPEGKRSARFVCSICCLFPNGCEIIAEQCCEGTVAFAPDGEGGFGYDPIFIERETGLTFGRLSDEQKDQLSHRGKALRVFAQELQQAIGSK